MFKYVITEKMWLPDDTPHERDLDVNRVAFHGTLPDDCVRIFGLYLDGAIWDPSTACLRESQMDERFFTLPEIKIMPVMVRSISHLSDFFDFKERIFIDKYLLFTSRNLHFLYL